MFILNSNGMCAQKFQVVHIFPGLQILCALKCVYVKINLELCSVSVLVLVATKIFSCFNKTGSKQDIKNEQEINILLFPFILYRLPCK
jgi:hypothetical protein